VVVLDAKVVTMQNLLSKFKRFIDTGYFSCAFGLIFVYGLLPPVSLGLSHFWLLLHFNRKKIFNLSVWRFAFRVSIANAENW